MDLVVQRQLQGRWRRIGQSCGCSSVPPARPALGLGKNYGTSPPEPGSSLHQLLAQTGRFIAERTMATFTPSPPLAVTAGASMLFKWSLPRLRSDPMGPSTWVRPLACSTPLLPMAAWVGCSRLQAAGRGLRLSAPIARFILGPFSPYFFPWARVAALIWPFQLQGTGYLVPPTGR